MTKEQKINNYTKLIAHFTAVLHDAVPPKHKHRPQQYKDFIRKELRLAKLALERLKS